MRTNLKKLQLSGLLFLMLFAKSAKTSAQTMAVNIQFPTSSVSQNPEKNANDKKESAKPTDSVSNEEHFKKEATRLIDDIYVDMMSSLIYDNTKKMTDAEKFKYYQSEEFRKKEVACASSIVHKLEMMAQKYGVGDSVFRDVMKDFYDTRGFFDYHVLMLIQESSSNKGTKPDVEQFRKDADTIIYIYKAKSEELRHQDTTGMDSTQLLGLMEQQRNYQLWALQMLKTVAFENHVLESGKTSPYFDAVFSDFCKAVSVYDERIGCRAAPLSTDTLYVLPNTSKGR